MPPKLYVDAPPNGDFRAMPARGAGYAILKWVTSFPDNPERGLPVVTGALLVLSATTGELVAHRHGRGHLAPNWCRRRRLCPGARAQGREERRRGRRERLVGGPVPAGDRVHRGCLRRRPPAGGGGTGRPSSAGERGELAEALACDVVVTVTPGDGPIVHAPDLRVGQHLAVLGADAHWKAELTA